jgi:hypothetical protein
MTRRKHDQPERCQFIEGTPTHRDDCKCLRPTQPGWPYCPEHVERVSPGEGRIDDHRATDVRTGTDLAH